MTELQTIQFEMLQAFWRVCEQLHLHPWMICGSALGAVKYQGFIPWDDDVDVALLRPEYERFLQEAPALLPERFFVQNARTDPAFPQLYTKLRLNGTSFVEERTADLPIHHGIYIDLFPLDGLPENKLASQRLFWRLRLCKLCLLSAYGEGGQWKERLIRRFGRLAGWHRNTARMIRRTEKALAAYSPAASSQWCCYGNWRVRRDCAPKEQYGEGAQQLFEGMQVCVPAQYDAYLAQRYGDWRSELPAHERHGRKAAVDAASDRLWRRP